jgi:hypothetical protein
MGFNRKWSELGFENKKDSLIKKVIIIHLDQFLFYDLNLKSK